MKFIFILLLVYIGNANAVIIDLKWPLDIATVKYALYKLGNDESGEIRVKNADDSILCKAKKKGPPMNLTPEDISKLEPAAKRTISCIKNTILIKLTDSIYNNIIQKAGQFHRETVNSSTRASRPEALVTCEFRLQSMNTTEKVNYPFQIPYRLLETIANPRFNLEDNYQPDASEKIKSIVERIARQHLSIPKN